MMMMMFMVIMMVMLMVMFSDMKFCILMVVSNSFFWSPSGSLTERVDCAFSATIAMVSWYVALLMSLVVVVMLAVMVVFAVAVLVVFSSNILKVGTCWKINRGGGCLVGRVDK